MKLPPCAGRSWTFDSTDYGDHLEARKICAECPLAPQCRVDVREEASRRTKGDIPGGCPEGTWGGELWINGRLIPAHKPEGAQRRMYEEQLYDEGAALRAHSAFNRGDRTEWAVTGNRVWERRRGRKRNQKVA